MKLDIRYANHPDDSKKYDTTELREKYLIEKVFEADDILLTYSHQDRIIAGGIMPVKKALKLETSKELAAKYFLERRELGFINIGGEGSVSLDGKTYEIKHKDGMYVGLGVKDIVFTSKDAKNPAKFYMTSSPAHKVYPNVYIAYTAENLKAFKGDIKAVEAIHQNLGDDAHMNKRIINKYWNNRSYR